LGATNVTLSFWLLCFGDAVATDSYFGRTYYSIDGGTTWIQNPTTYSQIDNWTQVTVTNPVFDNQADLRFAFMWVQNSANEFVAADPAFSIDDIKIEGITNVTNSIATGTITGSPFCEGSTFNVPFTSTGTFNVGNTYTAQLSDATGSFASPVNIGTISSTANSGAISVTIPIGTSAGNGYLIRVISSNPAITGTSSIAFTINTPVTPTFNSVANVCQNATAPVLPTSSTNSTPINGTWSPNVSTSSVGTTIYTFTPNAGQCATTATLSITVDANVTPTFNTIANVCQNSTAPILPTSSTNTTPITGTWSPTVSTTNPGSTLYTFTPDAGQCATNATLSITVEANITPTFNAVGPLCLNSVAPVLPLSSNDSPAITGTWNPAVVSTSTAGISTYTFTPDAGQCATVITMDIEITNSITPTFTAIGPLCIGSTAPILPTSSNNIPAITGTWNPAIINTNTVGTSTYTFTPDAGQCAGITTMDIEITNSITPSFGNIGPFCQGTTATLLPSTSTNIPAISGTWLPATINTNIVGLSTYTFTPDAGQCAATTTVDIEITSPNVVPTFLAIGPLCLNSISPSLPLSSADATPIVGTWNPSIINTSTAGISTYTFTPNGGQCATVATLIIEVTNSIIPTFSSIGPLCLGAVAPSLPNSSTNSPAITGTWNPATINTSSVGTVTYSFTADPNQCAANTTLDIEVSNGITPTFTTIAPLCEGAVAPILPTSSTNVPAITGTWSPSTINTAVTGLVTYTFTPDPGQCGTVTTLDVEVIATPPAPSISITSNLSVICAGQSIDFTATPNSVNTGDVIQWFINGIAVTGGTGLLFSSNTLNNNDQITAVFTPSSSCLAGQTATSNIILITVNPTVTPTISINATSTQICVGENVTFNAIISGGGSNPQVQWFINGNAVAGATSTSFSTSTLANTEQISAQITSNSPCASPNTANSNVLVMSVLPIATPTITISASSNIICQGQTVVFNAVFEFGGGAPQFIWQIGSSTFATTVPTFTTIGLSNSVSVSCTMISNYACTTNDTAISNTINIQVNPIPTVTLSEDVTIQEGESTNLTATATAAMTYIWTPSVSLSCSDCLTPTAKPEETTVYSFIVSDPASGCSANDSVKVTVIRNYDIWVPTAFSPNGDSKNDFFFVRGNNVKEFNIKLYDRWGNIVYESSNQAEGWNGEYKNRLINSGILVYILSYTLNDGTTDTMKGNITVSN
jgi:gliding motility-associated-like protein